MYNFVEAMNEGQFGQLDNLAYNKYIPFRVHLTRWRTGYKT